jgi:hypothetical protein
MIFLVDCPDKLKKPFFFVLGTESVSETHLLIDDLSVREREKLIGYFKLAVVDMYCWQGRIFKWKSFNGFHVLL